MNFSKSPEEQLDNWLKGTSGHDQFGRCCPDFSCCYPELKWPDELRSMFMLRLETRPSLISMALSALYAKEGRVTIVEGDHLTKM